MRNIAVIGAGLSGTLLTINLLKQDCSDSINIIWIDRDDENSLGPAYSTNEDYLLNVPAERMGALSKDPEHFLKWTLSQNIPAAKGDYLPRKLYRKYIQELLQQAKTQKKDKTHLERITGEAEDIKIEGSCANISVAGYGNFSADKVVLALGNSPPGHPAIRNKSFINYPGYIRNPWKSGLLESIKEYDKIFFLGTGQTMVDLAAGLYRKKHKGKLVAISRHGILPMVQKNYEPCPSFYEELKNQDNICTIFSIVRKHIKNAETRGMDPRAVIDSLRPFTSLIWMQLQPDERKRFLRHVFRYWEIIRSRIPPASDNIIKELISSGQLKIIAGRVLHFSQKENSIEIFYNLARTDKEVREEAEMVINCIGPNTDYEQIEQKLIKNLFSEKTIHCDALHLGIDAKPDGAIIKNNGSPSDILFTIGPALRGILWETTAAPEIRLQAELLAEKLLSD